MSRSTTTDAGRSTCRFKLCARDPDGTILRIDWGTKIIPRKGDLLWLPDSPIGGPFSVSDVVLYPSGEVEVWAGFISSEPGSTTTLFRKAESYVSKTVEPLDLTEDEVQREIAEDEEPYASERMRARRWWRLGRAPSP